MKKMTVSVGIAAYNEEANIGKLLTSLLKQKQSNYILKEIIVISDASTDNTVSIVKKVKSKKIKVFVNKKRIGAALSQNKILKLFSSEILVLIDADVLPKNNLLIKFLVQSFLQNKNIGIVGAKTRPLPSITTAERIINLSVSLKQELYESIRNGNNIYLCHGRIRAFSKKFASKFKWKATIGEDAFSYFSCISKNLKFIYQPKAIVLYRSPQSFADHLKQSVRFLKSKSKMKEFFGDKIVQEEYKTQLTNFLRIGIKHFFRNPVLFLIYTAIYQSAKIIKLVSPTGSTSWAASTSTKKL